MGIEDKTTRQHAYLNPRPDYKYLIDYEKKRGALRKAKLLAQASALSLGTLMGCITVPITPPAEFDIAGLSGRNLESILLKQEDLAERFENTSRYNRLIRQAEKEHRIPEGRIAGIIMVESNGIKTKTNPSGAAGLTMLMPETARELGISPGDRFNPYLSINSAAEYFEGLIKSEGSADAATVAYNRGPYRKNPRWTAYLRQVIQCQDYYNRHIRNSAQKVTMANQNSNDLRWIYVRKKLNGNHVYKAKLGKKSALADIARNFNEWDNNNGNKHMPVSANNITDAKRNGFKSEYLPTGIKVYINAASIGR